MHRLGLAPWVWQWPCDLMELVQPGKRQIRFGLPEAVSAIGCVSLDAASVGG